MKTKVLIIDDDPDILSLLEKFLNRDGYNVLTIPSSTLAMDAVREYKPDVILLDLMMPDIDGFDITKQIKDDSDLNKIKIIIITAKNFEFDQNRTLELGADCYLKKPIKPDDLPFLKKTIDSVLKDSMTITFWGTRGTIPKPEKNSLKYGGNTSCVSVEMSKDRLFIFDAGTGITKLGEHLIKKGKKHTKMNLFITHPHWDHIHGFPFCKALYVGGNEMAVYGSSHGDISLREVMSGQMKSIHFPITLKEFASRVYFKEIAEGEHKIEGLSVKAINLNHPGVTLGYRVTNTSLKSMVYMTDNEVIPETSPNYDVYCRKRLINFLKDADVLIHDSSYFHDEYLTKVGWGHPSILEVLKLAKQASVKKLYLYHHDPDHNDDDVARMEEIGNKYFKDQNVDTKCIAAVEGTSICL